MKNSVIFVILIFSFSIVSISHAQMRRLTTGGESQSDFSKLYYRKCWALLVGINTYPNLPPQYQLNYAVADAEGVASLLQDKFGFSENNITILKDEEATKEGILKALNLFADRENIKKEDGVLFFFAGHAQTVPTSAGGEMGYLIPYDANVDLSGQPNPAQYLSYCIGMDVLNQTAQYIEAKHILFIVDACYSGLVLKSSRGLDHKIPGYLIKVAKAKAVQMITAGGAGEESGESSKYGHGVFTYKLIEALKNGIADWDTNGVITGSELGTYLRTAVPKIADQTPQFRMEGEGEFMFLLSSGEPIEPQTTLAKHPETTHPQPQLIDILKRIAYIMVVACMFALAVFTVIVFRKQIKVAVTGKITGTRVEEELSQTGPAPSSIDRKKSEITESSEAVLQADSTPKFITGKDGAPMALIPAGEFQMGSEDGESDEKPAHTVHLDAFYIDTHEVTNAQYAKFLNEYGKNTDPDGHQLLGIDNEYCLIEKVGDTYSPKEGYENHPVIYVSWHGAVAYAKHYGKRLPTEAEWEKAARGGLTGKKYPWGDEIDPTKANYNQGRTEEDVFKALKPVGEFPANDYGLYDMAGNVFEWCADLYGSGYYKQSPKENPKGPSLGDERILRGGSWGSYESEQVRVACRYKEFDEACSDSVGFRCAQDVASEHE